MPTTLHAKLFRNGRSQAVRIPKEFQFSGDEVLIHREGHKIILEPAGSSFRMLALLDRLKPIHDRFPNVDKGLRPLDDVNL